MWLHYFVGTVVLLTILLISQKEGRGLGCAEVNGEVQGLRNDKRGGGSKLGKEKGREKER